MTEQPSRLSITVAIATSGRPEILRETLLALRAQTRRADRVIVCPARDGDFDAGEGPELSDISIVRGPAGLPAQRNSLLSAASDADVVVFFDDDFFADPAFLAEVEDLFATHPDIVVATGTVAADGILGPGLELGHARQVIAGLPAMPAQVILPVHNAYGCNMIIRMAPVRAQNLRFDEALPLYGWLEDVDFSRRLAPFGRIVRTNRLRGVHLGHKSGRSSGLRLGYSQIANPLYMVRKGTLDRRRAYRQIGRNLLANLAGALRPEPWVDRKGRLKGNLRGLFDVIGRRHDPRRILEM